MDLRIVWLGIEGTWPATKFDRTLREYLTQTCQVSESVLRSRPHNRFAGSAGQEDGGRAIEDIATHFDWRPGANRGIFFLGDEGLDAGGDQLTPQDIEAANQAIRAARGARVAVHTYFGISLSRQKAALQAEYARVARETQGRGFSAQDSGRGFATLLEEVICATRDWGPTTSGREPLTTGVDMVSEPAPGQSAPTPDGLRDVPSGGVPETAHPDDSSPDQPHVQSPTGLAPKFPDPSANDLTQQLQHLQNMWQSAQGQLQQLGLSGGLGASGAAMRAFDQMMSQLHLTSSGATSGFSTNIAEFEQWQSQFDDAQTLFQHVQELLKQAQSVVSEATQTVFAESQTAKQTTQSGNEALRVWLAAMETVLGHYEQHRTTTQTALGQTQAVLSQVEVAFKLVQTERDTLWTRINELEAALVKSEQASSDQHATAIQVQQLQAQFHAERTALQSRITELEAALGQREERVTVLQATLSSESEAKEAAQGERTALRQRITELETALARREVSVETIQQELQRIEGVRRTVMTQVEQWEARYNDSQAELVRLQGEFRRVVSENQNHGQVMAVAETSWRKRLDQMETALKANEHTRLDAQQQIARLTAELSRWEDRGRQAEEQYQAVRLELQRLTAQAQDQAAGLLAAQNDRHALVSQINELRRQLAHRESMFTTLQQELQKAVDMRRSALAERAQWEQNYLSALSGLHSHVEQQLQGRSLTASTMATQRYESSSTSQTSSHAFRVSGQSASGPAP